MLVDYAKTTYISTTYYLYLYNSSTQRQLPATNPNSTTHNGSQHRRGCLLPSPNVFSLAPTISISASIAFALRFLKRRLFSHAEVGEHYKQGVCITAYSGFLAFPMPSWWILLVRDQMFSGSAESARPCWWEL